MSTNEPVSETSLSFQQIVELLSRPQTEERPGASKPPSERLVDKPPSREVVLKVIEGLKQV